MIAAETKEGPAVGAASAPRECNNFDDSDFRPTGRSDATSAARSLGAAPWNDVEIARFLKRVGLFKRRGLPAEGAEALADSLVHRDRDRDDRRCCVECDSLQQGGTCFRGLPISKTQLVRCHGFRWQQP